MGGGVCGQGMGVTADGFRVSFGGEGVVLKLGGGGGGTALNRLKTTEW